MNACRSLVTVVVALWVVTAIWAANEPGDGKNSGCDVQALQKQVAELEARVKGLENRLEKLESAGKPAASRSPAPGVPPPTMGLPGADLPTTGFPAHGRQNPKIWGQGEVNGWTYYLIPLKAQ